MSKFVTFNFFCAYGQKVTLDFKVEVRHMVSGRVYTRFAARRELVNAKGQYLSRDLCTKVVESALKLLITLQDNVSKCKTLSDTMRLEIASWLAVSVSRIAEADNIEHAFAIVQTTALEISTVQLTSDSDGILFE